MESDSRISPNSGPQRGQASRSVRRRCTPAGCQTAGPWSAGSGAPTGDPPADDTNRCIHCHSLWDPDGFRVDYVRGTVADAGSWRATIPKRIRDKFEVTGFEGREI